MPVDFTKFPFPGIRNPLAPTIADAIKDDTLEAGFAVITAKVGEVGDYLETIRRFAQAQRAIASRTGLTSSLAFRQLRPDERGGVVPFDQTSCEKGVASARRRLAEQPGRYPTIELALKMAESNDVADWALLVEFRSPQQANAAAAKLSEDATFISLTESASGHSVGAFKNTVRYADVLRDPDVIHFFNFFSGPGDIDALSSAWLEAMPWFFEVGEFRSALPLVALDDDQSFLVVNYAHLDSMKHFLLGVEYDPGYIEAVTPNAERGFPSPKPFFCKIMHI